MADRPKRNFTKRIGNLAGDLLDKGLQVPESRGGVRRHLEQGAQLEAADADALKDSTIETVKARKALEREYKEKGARLLEYWDLLNEANAAGDAEAIALASAKVQRLAPEVQRLEEDLDEMAREEASVKEQRDEQIERADRAEHDAARRAREYERDQQKVERIRRRMGLGGPGDQVAQRNLNKALKATEDKRNEREALEELQDDPNMRARRPGLGEASEDADIARLRKRLGVGSDPMESARRAMRALSEAAEERDRRALGSAGPVEAEADEPAPAEAPAAADAPAQPERAEAEAPAPAKQIQRSAAPEPEL